MKQPISLTIVGTIWLLLGLVGLVGSAFESHAVQVPGIHFLNFLVGIGLLQAWKPAWWYAVITAGAGMVFGLVAFSWVLASSGDWVFALPFSLIRDQRPHPALALPLLAGLWAGYVALAGGLFWVLRRPDVRQAFAKRCVSGPGGPAKMT